MTRNEVTTKHQSHRVQRPPEFQDHTKLAKMFDNFLRNQLVSDNDCADSLCDLSFNLLLFLLIVFPLFFVSYHSSCHATSLVHIIRQDTSKGASWLLSFIL